MAGHVLVRFPQSLRRSVLLSLEPVSIATGLTTFFRFFRRFVSRLCPDFPQVGDYMQPTGGRRSRLKSGWLWMDSMIIDRSARSWSALSKSCLAGSLLVPLKGRIVYARRFPEHCRTSPGNPPRPRATALTNSFSCSRVLGRGVGIPVRAIREEIPVDPIQPHDDHSRMGSSIASSAIAQVLRHVEASRTA